MASFYHHCLSSAFSKASKLSLFISVLESKDIEKPGPENKVFVLCLYHPGWPPQEAERADSCVTLAVPSVCPRVRGFSCRKPAAQAPVWSASKMMSRDGQAVPAPTSLTDRDEGGFSPLLSQKEGEILDFDTFFLKSLGLCLN